MSTLQYLVESDNMLIAHSSSLGIMFTTGGKAAATAPTMPWVEAREGGGGEFESWGEENDFPQQIIDLYSKNTLIPRLLGDKAAEMVGGGLIAMKVVGFKNGQEQLEWIDDPEIKSWLDDFQLNRTLFEMANDLQWFYNGWVEMIPSVDRTKIVGLVHQEAAFCRWEKQRDNGKRENVWLSSEWPNFDTKKAKLLPAIDLIPLFWRMAMYCGRIRMKARLSICANPDLRQVGLTYSLEPTGLFQLNRQFLKRNQIGSQ